MTLPMTTIDYERVRATRAPVWQRQLIRIPEDSISCHHSSLTDYLDRTVCYSPEGMRQIDSLIEKYRLGAVNKTMNDHYGTVLPRINRKDQILGGSVIYFDAEKGDMLKSEPLTDNLYQWYCFDYYTDDSVFFGEHTLSGKPVAVVQEEDRLARCPGDAGNRLAGDRTWQRPFGRDGPKTVWPTGHSLRRRHEL